MSTSHLLYLFVVVVVVADPLLLIRSVDSRHVVSRCTRTLYRRLWSLTVSLSLLPCFSPFFPFIIQTAE